MKRFLAALRFLTVLPVPGAENDDETSLAGSTVFFPVVGLLIGGIAAGLSQLFGAFFPPLPAAVLAVIVLFAASRGLHMDGLADMSDGFFSSRPRERILDIMRDSRIGTMGVIAVVCTLALKIAALASLSPNAIWGPVLLMPVAGRCAILILMAILPYARSEDGLGSLFYTSYSRVTAIWGIGFVTACGWFVAKATGVYAVGLTLMAVLFFAGWCHRKIGGTTGDTLGGGCEMAETVIALGFCALPG